MYRKNVHEDQNKHVLQYIHEIWSRQSVKSLIKDGVCLKTSKIHDFFLNLDLNKIGGCQWLFRFIIPVEYKNVLLSCNR